MEENIKKAKQVLKDADAILITAGAGMGVDSGLPDFRGDEGFWKAYPPLKKLGISFSQMANPEWFEKNPALAWGFYGHRLNLYRNTTPHDGFRILLEYANSKKGSYFIFTSNVDGQFQKAGFDDNRIMECHGSIHYLQCTQNCSDDIWSSSSTQVKVDLNTFNIIETIPECKNCNTISRPNILMFGDWSWNPKRSDEQASRFQRWIEEINLNRYKLAIIEIGAGEAVPTVRLTSQEVAQRYNATLIRINPKDFSVPEESYVSIQSGGLEGIKKICNGQFGTI